MVKVMITMMEVVTLLLLQVYLSLSVRRYSACNATKTWLPPVACGLVASFLPSRFTVSKVAPPPPLLRVPFPSRPATNNCCLPLIAVVDVVVVDRSSSLSLFVADIAIAVCSVAAVL